MGLFRSSTGKPSDQPRVSPLALNHSHIFSYSWRRALKVTGVIFLVAGGFATAVLADNHNSPPPASATPPASNPSASTNSSTSLNLQANTQSTPSGSSVNTSSGTSVESTLNTTSNGTETHVNVNGKDVPVPKNGSVQHTYTDSIGTTSVNISSNSGGDNSSSTSLDVNVTTNSSTAGGTQTFSQSQTIGGAY